MDQPAYVRAQQNIFYTKTMPSNNFYVSTTQLSRAKERKHMKSLYV